MSDFTVFSLDADAGRVETVTAPDPEAAAALVQAKYPEATTSAIPAEQVEGCNRTKLLWEWMATVTWAHNVARQIGISILI